jgi:hypothetical protein
MADHKVSAATGLTTRIEDEPTREAWEAWVTLAVDESLKGSVAATQAVARIMYGHLHRGATRFKNFHNLRMGSSEARWLFELLKRLLDDDSSVARVVSRPAGKRGRTSKGFEGFNIAFLVLDALSENGASSVEKAWAMVADTRGIDAETVKKHWIKWKPHVLKTCESKTPGLPASIKEMIAKNKAGK